MRDKKSTPVTTIGIASLLMVFIVVSMSIIAVMSLNDALRDYNYSKRLAEHNTAYYEASNIAQEQIAIIDKARRAGNLASVDKLDGVKGLEVRGEACAFVVEIDERQDLSVTVKATSSGIKVTDYSSVQSKEWDGDLSLNVIK